jgi:hypothetical protein
VPTFFALGDLAGDPQQRTCTRTDVGAVGCPVGSPLGTLRVDALAGSVGVTFGACSAFVLGDDETCDFAQTEIEFP